MKSLRLIIATVAGAWLETSFLGAWRPLGVIPDLFLVVILVAASSKTRASEVVAMAIGGGFLLDFSSGTDFGLRTAFFCFLGLLLIMMRRTGVDFERLSMKLAAVFSATILYDAVVLIPLLSSRSSIVWSVLFGRVAVQTLLNVVLLGALYLPLRKLFDAGATSQPVINQNRS